MRIALLTFFLLAACGGLSPLARDVPSLRLEIEVDEKEPTVGGVLIYRRWLRNTSTHRVKVCTIDRGSIIVWGSGGPKGGHAGSPTHVSCIPSRTFSIPPGETAELPADSIPVNPEIGLGSAWTRATVDVADPYACTLDRCATFTLSSEKIDLQIHPAVAAPN